MPRFLFTLCCFALLASTTNAQTAKKFQLPRTLQAIPCEGLDIFENKGIFEIKDAEYDARERRITWQLTAKKDNGITDRANAWGLINGPEFTFYDRNRNVLGRVNTTGNLENLRAGEGLQLVLDIPDSVDLGKVATVVVRRAGNR